MNEHYLHFLWKTKRLPFHVLRTINDQEIRILHVGLYNTGSGPDFFNGQMELDGVIHTGNIELHIKSSDWYVHGHQYDAAYSNVILHVVYEHDRLVFVEGVPIPTIALKNHIDWAHFRQSMYFTHSSQLVPCASFLENCPAPIRWNQVELALIERLSRKSYELSVAFPSEVPHPKKVLFYALATAFGMKMNALPFKELAQRLPFERLIKCSKREKEALIFGVSGLINETTEDAFEQELRSEWLFQQNRLSIHPANRQIWQFKGCRPQGFPSLRLAQFASFTDRMDWSASFWELPVQELKAYILETLMAEPSDYWRTHYDFGKQKRTSSSGAMSKSTAHVILLNSIVPFLGWLSAVTFNGIYREKSLELLESLPPEKNLIIEQWSDLGMNARSAADTQGLLELNAQWCAKKSCLKCRIGQQVLGQKA